ncbi:MAG: 5'-nucleotidase C-terminal domain-containing protein [Spirochaetia bacterium]|nr:5'-nucleotidase C-terminal domain-containing protein [Spirochaetia bacterium]
MKPSRIAIALVALLSLLVSCQTAPIAEYGSLDRAAVELLANGSARRVDIVSFNDFHAALVEELTVVDGGVIVQGKNPGMAKLATAMRDMKRTNPNTVFVSAGDSYQGSALSILSEGRIVSEFLKSMGVAASAVGNHEFDWGDGHFAEWSASGGFPFLAANIVEKATGEIPSWAKPYVIIKVGGHRIALLGLATLETPTATTPANVAAYDFLDAAATARFWVNRIRATEKPEVLIALTHIPAAVDKLDASRAVSASELGELEALAAVDGIDAIVTGHSHARVSAKTDGVPVVQAYYNGRGLGRIAITFRDDGSFSLSTGFVDLYSAKDSILEDPEAKALYARYMAEHGATLLREVATVEGDLSHDRSSNVTPMGLWVGKAMIERFGAQVAIMNGGGLRKGFAPGQVAVQDFWDLMPFDNTAVVFKAKGSALRAMIEHGLDSVGFGNGQFAGLVVEYDPMKPQGAKIVSMRLADGTPVADDGLYAIVTNDFIFEGGDGYVMMKANALDAVNTFVPIRDALVEAAEKAGVIRAEKPEVLEAVF